MQGHRHFQAKVKAAVVPIGEGSHGKRARASVHHPEALGQRDHQRGPSFTCTDHAAPLFRSSFFLFFFLQKGFFVAICTLRMIPVTPLGKKPRMILAAHFVLWS
jgi:hypothetical protein